MLPPHLFLQNLYICFLYDSGLICFRLQVLIEYKQPKGLINAVFVRYEITYWQHCLVQQSGSLLSVFPAVEFRWRSRTCYKTHQTVNEYAMRLIYLLMRLMGQLQYIKVVDSGGFELFLPGDWPCGHQNLLCKIIGLLFLSLCAISMIRNMGRVYLS